MINTIIIDKNQNNREVLSKYLNNIENVKTLNLLDDFNSDSLNLVEINLIIFDINSNNFEETVLKIKEIKNSNPQISFIATSSEINSDLVEKTMQEGVLDFLLKPVIPNILQSAIAKISNSQTKKASTICIFSNKGGIGKTSIAVNVAYEIALKTNEKVCLLDLSFNSEDAATFLNIEPKYNIDYIIENIETSDKELLLSLIDKYENSNLYVLSSRQDMDLKEKPTPQTITKIINSLKNIFSYIIIDTSSTLDEISLSIVNCSDLILLIGLLNMPSIRSCQKILELFNTVKFSEDRIKLIINRFIDCEITLEDIKNTLGKEVFNKIPNNYLTLIDAINLGHPVGKINPNSNIAKAYKKTANDIVETNFDTLGKNASYNHGIFNLLHKIGE